MFIFPNLTLWNVILYTTNETTTIKFTLSLSEILNKINCGTNCCSFLYYLAIEINSTYMHF